MYVRMYVRKYVNTPYWEVCGLVERLTRLSQEQEVCVCVCVSVCASDTYIPQVLVPLWAWEGVVVASQFFPGSEGA